MVNKPYYKLAFYVNATIPPLNTTAVADTNFPNGVRKPMVISQIDIGFYLKDQVTGLRPFTSGDELLESQIISGANSQNISPFLAPQNDVSNPLQQSPTSSFYAIVSQNTYTRRFKYGEYIWSLGYLRFLNTLLLKTATGANNTTFIIQYGIYFQFLDN
jgi:hypothetical protein